MIMKTNWMLAVLAIVLLGCGQGKQEEQTKKRPNIVLLYTDDQTYESIRALGNQEIITPNLDKLVSMGSTFTHAYNMGGWHGAVCVASRSMMVSGRFVWNAKAQEPLWRDRDSTAMAQTWGRIMAANGYNTYMSGKWHVQAPSKQVFDKVANERPGMPGDRRGELGKAIKKWKEESGKDEDWNKYMPIGYGRPLSKDDNSWNPADTVHGGFWQGGKHWSEVVKDDALGFLEEATTKEDPFFMYLAFNAPHDPRQAPQSFVDMYPLENISLPASFQPEHPLKNEIGNNRGLRDEALAPFPRTAYAVKKHRQEYYAIITHLDEQIGKIVDALEKAGQLDNTYVFFTSDHGLSVGQHGLLGKQSLYDHSIRVPLMVMGPDIPQGKKFEQDVYLQDVMATSLDLAGIEKPDHVEFNSFMDIVAGKRKESYYDGVYGCYVDYQRMIRKDGFKLLVFPKAETIQLFDLKNDPEEMNNLAQNPEYVQKVKTLFDQLISMQKVYNDNLDLSELYSSVM